MSRKFLAALAGACLLSGCVVTSLHPLYTDDDLVFDPALAGDWVEDGNDADFWSFKQGDGKSYVLVLSEGDKTAEFDARLVKLKDRLFLDIYPSEKKLNEIEALEPYGANLLATHSFAKVIQIEPVLQLAFLSNGWLEELLKNDPAAIRHEMAGDRLVLTASTKDLQAFLLKHCDNNEAFGKMNDLKRRVLLLGDQPDRTDGFNAATAKP